MKHKNFEDLRYFKADSTIDRWGDPKQMDRKLLLMLDELRHQLGQPVYVISGFRSPKPGRVSQHYYGKAVDIVCPAMRGDLLQVYLEAERFPFTGLGVYPHWKYNEWTVGGLHLDTRSLGETERAARWMGILAKEFDNGVEVHVQKYVSLNDENMRRYLG